ncbi:hypothetical protein [Dyadobacter sediminis]|uniref:Exo-alpha-sialidase n=1 Tax=Dyadobacter sediminis TaxID=1493691 RepID=A0A5R9KI27_9BACT|nr:hypothetical protein [Dyadobacter sediminis]TLU95832.1 hypothetical protein FEM55_01340 [Dyadobacter sediminis]GGB76941.1 hypothetical protein GCM10011325_00550 [Dyadobacter sediminis]
MMKHSVTVLLSLLFLFACRKDSEVPTPEKEAQHPDWYILHAPDEHGIQAVYGDIDGTLLLTDRRHIHYTKDKGKTWKQASYDSSIGLSGFAMTNDTLFVLDTETVSSSDSGNVYAKHPYQFSVDGGISWKKLDQQWSMPEMKTPLNYSYSANGIRFSIDRFIDSNGHVEDKGIKSENGRRIGLPRQHVLKSIYFDKKSRLYISGSAPLCHTDGYMQLCDKENARGTLYISRQEIRY